MEKSCKRSAIQSFKNSKALLLLLSLLLISSLYYVHCSLDFSVTCEPSSAQNGRALLEINPPNKQSTVKIHEEQHNNNPTASSTTKDRQFGMAAHEVPSGPNPESNR
ncbi:hypothetical protein ACH5RR_032731 [Cinchona calisaya]|uniref:Uncharacterized protein n=1 Tax=Cinchona calisaya TaxID=153742 RepID=A0ABD2YLE0_9GENT